MVALIGPYTRIVNVNWFNPKNYVWNPFSLGVFSTLNHTQWKVGGTVIAYPANIGDGIAQTSTKAAREAFLASHSIWTFLEHLPSPPNPLGEQKWSSGYAVGRAIAASGGKGSFSATLSQNGVTIFQFSISAPFTKDRLIASGAFDFVADGGP